MRRLLKLTLILFALAQVAATCQGTETGNPGIPGGGCPGASPTDGSETAIDGGQILDDLILRICQKIVMCGISTTVDACVNALNGVDGDPMTDEFGLPEGEFTVAELRNALNDGTVFASEAGADSCEVAIGDVACGEVEANVSVTEFSGTENFIPEACAAVFSVAGVDAAPGEGCP